MGEIKEIREAFTEASKGFEFAWLSSKDMAYSWFKKGYKSQQAEIERLNLERIRLGGSIDLMVKSEESKDKEIDRLKAENEAMRCCGNCEHSGDRGQSLSWKYYCRTCTRNIGYTEEKSDNWKPK